jgi:hypothetical protein
MLTIQRSTLSCAAALNPACPKPKQQLSLVKDLRLIDRYIEMLTAIPTLGYLRLNR